MKPTTTITNSYKTILGTKFTKKKKPRKPFDSTQITGSTAAATPDNRHRSQLPSVPNLYTIVVVTDTGCCCRHKNHVANTAPPKKAQGVQTKNTNPSYYVRP
jgi:hypothetical protein